MSVEVATAVTEVEALPPCKPCCSRCGSMNVLRDAWATWDAQAGDWVLSSVFDHAFCIDCDAETTLTDR
jgi:hypothetical protein